jgi:hypothetical protein
MKKMEGSQIFAQNKPTQISPLMQTVNKHSKLSIHLTSSFFDIEFKRSQIFMNGKTMTHFFCHGNNAIKCHDNYEYLRIKIKRDERYDSGIQGRIILGRYGTSMLNIRSIVREKSLEENINKLFARQI